MQEDASTMGRQARRTPGVLRAPLRRLAPLSAALALFAFAAAPSGATADTTICSPGAKAGQCESPQGTAVDFETGDLYVADRANNRIDVFKADGTFLRAFGWGVDTGANALQTCTTTSTCQAGIAGSGPGQLDHPSWVAVDNNVSSPSRHDLYVGADNFHLQKFTPTGEFLKAFGTQGTGECQISRSADPIAVGPGGDVYLADSFEQAANQFKSRVERFDSEGSCLGEVTLFEDPIDTIDEFGVDSAGNFYVMLKISGKLRKYGPAGTLIYELGSSNEARGGELATEAQAIGIDEEDNVFTRQRGSVPLKKVSDSFITEYDSSGAILRRFGYSIGAPAPRTVSSLTPYDSAAGNLIANSEGEVKYLSFPPAGPQIMPSPCSVKEGALGNVKATLQAEVNPEGKATTVHYEYISEADFIANENSFEGVHEASQTPDSEPLDPDFNMHEALGEANLEPQTAYRCRAVAANADGSTTGEEGTFTSRPPLEIGNTTVSGVKSEEATLNATVNPLGIATSGYFEYVEEATFEKDTEELGPGHGFDHATKAPDPEAEEAISFGAGNSFQLGQTTVDGLEPATTYRFRVIATNLFFESKGEVGVLGPTRSFRTYSSSSEALPDQRAWELVSPGEKNSAEVAVHGAAGGFFEPRTIRIQAGSTDGDAVTYTSWTSFGKAEGATSASQYLSKRTGTGWATENISPYGFFANVLFPPYVGFSPDLRYAAFKTTEPPLTPDCRTTEDLYLRDNDTGQIRCLTPEVSDGSEAVCLVYAGSSTDGARSFLAGKPSGGEDFTYSLYESSTAGGPKLVSVFPNGEAAPPTEGTAFGPSETRNGIESCQVTRTILHHAISADGGRVFWTYAPEAPGEPNQLYVRVNGEETFQLDKHQSGAGSEAGGGSFRGASADGSVAYFTDTKALVSGAHPKAGEPDLYRYEVGQPNPLSDLTKGAVPGNVKGVVGISDDGSYVYFVAGAVLSGTEEDEAGERALEGARNLYLFHEGKTTFIARLAAGGGDIIGDQSDWSAEPRELSARVSPDGAHLAFLSTEAEALGGYDNTIAEGEHCRYSHEGPGGSVKLLNEPLCSQAFLYDAGTGRLSCASCNPSGARPLGPTVVPGWSNGFEGPRYLSDDGGRLFFESLDTISAGDENEKMDVYEFEQRGTGTCTAQSPAFDPVAGGCHFLISGGRSEDETHLIDVSADGSNVFFSTRQSLTGWDINENYDVYDAREGGGLPEPDQEQICAAEGCKSPANAAPSFVGPSHFEGPGNPHQTAHRLKPSKKKAHAHKKKRHRKANHKRRARR